MSKQSTHGLTTEEREVLEWLRDNSDRLASISDQILNQQATSESQPDLEEGSGTPSATPAKRHGRPVGDAFVWVAYYGDNDDIEHASSKISTVISELQEELGE